jgi:aspartyl protease family protein
MITRFPALATMLFSGLLLVANDAVAVENISLQALFKDKAIILVDGARRVLKSGDESPEGVRLLTTDTREEQAEIEIGGRREVLKLGVVTAGFASQGKGNVTLYPDRSGHFFVDGTINGASVRFLVDTGATTIAMNGNTASRIGLDYRRLGRAGIASTAAGNVRTYNLKLDSVQVGDITLRNVPAGVIEGSHPTEVLLGMSFLGQLDLKQDNEKMELRER